VQDAFLRAFRSFGQWRGDNAKAWILTIVRRAFFDQINTSSHRASTCEASDWTRHLVVVEDPESLLSEKSDAAMLHKFIHMLPLPFRETLILRELEEMSYKEIADMTQVPIGTVMSRLSRARQMLTEQMAPPLPPEELESASAEAC
jgi:RNA polymerase sigma factor (sigma-70 family)